MNMLEDQMMIGLNESFKDLDAKVLENTITWAIERQEKLQEFLDSDQYKNSGRGYRQSFECYDEMFRICTGKGWYQKMRGSGKENLANHCKEYCERTILNRNAAIMKKLTKANITEVVSSKFSYSNDGFNGVFSVETNTGAKTITINTVYAGGYNVQCLHLRILVKIR
jgi:hypothetical protein